MNANIVALAGIPPSEMSGKLIGVGCPCMQGMGADEPATEAQATSLRWVGLSLVGIVAVALIYSETRRHHR